MAYLVEALQPLLDLSQFGVRAANFDLWVLLLGLETVPHHSACVTRER
jgi:hypothetical protein